MIRRIILAGVLILSMCALVFAQGTTPPIPTNLTAEALSEPSVKLTWDAPTGLWGYKIYRSTGDQLHFGALGVATSSKIYYDNNVLPGDTYYYYVTSVMLDLTGQIVESGASNVANASVSGVTSQGMIKGTIVDKGVGTPVANVQVQLLRISAPPPQWWVQVITDNQGNYGTLLDTGTYIVHAQPPFIGSVLYKDQWYDNAPDSASATIIQLNPGATVVADFKLERVSSTGPTGTISGTIVEEGTSVPIPHVKIFFFRTSSMYYFVPITETDANGQYSAILDTGTYKLRAQPPLGSMSVPGYRPEWYDNASSAQTATPVAVTPGSTFTADIVLSKNPGPELASVEGTVTDESSGEAIPNARVVFMRTIQEMNSLAAISGSVPGTGEESIEVDGLGLCRGVIWSGRTDTLGHYAARVVKGRSYVAFATAWGHAPKFYNDKPGPLSADIITVNGDMTGIDFALAALPVLSNSISGVVRDSIGNGVASRIVVFPANAIGPFLKSLFGHTDANGAYVIGNLPAGYYRVLAVPFCGYAPAFYKNGAYGIIRWKEADLVDVTGDVTGIDIGVVKIHSRGLARLLGRVLDPLGAGIEGAEVCVVTDQGENLGVSLSDADGNYTIEAVGTGSATLIVDREGYNHAEAPVTVSPSSYDVSNGDITLTPVSATTVGDRGQLPTSFEVYQNYPNPFNPSTAITFDLPTASLVRLTIFNVLGQEVATLVNESRAAGSHSVTWNGRDAAGKYVSSGVYFYTFSATGANGSEKSVQFRKMILMK